MTELARLSQRVMEEISVPRASLDELRGRNRSRRVKRRALGVCALAVVVALGFGVLATQRTPLAPQSPTRLASYFQAAVDVPTSTLQAVGLPSTVSIPTMVTPSLSTVATNGVVSYVGAEYCPYCALQRWALLVALSKFGTFTHLDNEVLSSSSDVYPHLASWSFLGAAFRSTYFKFDSAELFSSEQTPGGSGDYQRLQKLSTTQRVAYNRYDPQGTIPFVDVGNHYVTLGASSSPSVLEGLSLSEIGNDLRQPRSPVAEAIDGAANYLIAAMCSVAHKPTPTLCSSGIIRAAARALTSGSSTSTKSSSSLAYPTQPPTNAPLALWKKWSVAEHKWWLHVAATYRAPNPACTVEKIDVTGRKLSKTLFGIPKGVWLWGMGLTGSCPPGDSGGLIQRAK